VRADFCSSYAGLTRVSMLRFGPRCLSENLMRPNRCMDRRIKSGNDEPKDASFTSPRARVEVLFIRHTRLDAVSHEPRGSSAAICSIFRWR
jgi:hypothetical protein